MAIKYRSGRQEVIAATIEIAFNDPAEDGEAENAISLPANAIVVGGDVTVLEAWDSGTSATLKLGDADDDDRYTGTPVNLKNAGRTALTLTGYKHAIDEFLKATFAQEGTAATQGKARITVLYVVEGRAAFSQGLDYRGPGIPGA